MEDIGIGSDVKLSSDQSAAVLAKIKATWGQSMFILSESVQHDVH